MASSARDRPWTLAGRVAIAFGVAVSILQVTRAQVGGDQFYQLVRGWMFAYGDWWVPFGVHTSSGGFSPGGLLSLLHGAPLLVWQDHRAVAAFGLVAHAVAGVWLYRACAPALSAPGRFLLILLWWVNPWRMHYSTFAWNPNWMFVLGAIHIATARRMAHRPAFLATFVHVAVACLGIQVHNSFLILPLATGLLWWRRGIRLHFVGATAGALFAAATLVPWALLAFEYPAILPIGGHGFLGRGLVTVYPVARGVLYLLRYPSFALGRDITDFDFGPAFGERADAVLTPLVGGLVAVAGVVTVVLALIAMVRLWRRRPKPVFGPLADGAGERAWLVTYVRWSLIAAAASFALSPTTAMSWQGFAVFHAAIVPLVLYGEAALRSRKRVAVRRIVIGWSLLTVVVCLAVAIASPMYRRGGRHALGVRVREVPVFLEELGVTRTGTVRVRPDGDNESHVLLGPDHWQEGLAAGREKM